MFSTDPETRKAYISALHDLADYLTANPAIPVPAYGSILCVHDKGADHGGREQVDRIAGLLGTLVEDKTATTGYYETTRSFGPIGYCVWAVSDQHKARHEAAASYWGCVTPDAGDSDA